MHLRFSPFRPWQPLSDREWQVLSGFVVHARAGRPPADHRTRLDGIFLATTAGIAWSGLGEGYGDPDTLRRQFHRWATQGLFDTLLHAARDPVAPQARVLRGMEHWLCCAYRRAIPIGGKTVAELLGYASALRPADLRRGPSNLSGMIETLLKSVDMSRGASAAPLRLTSPRCAAIGAPHAVLGRGRWPAQAVRAASAGTAPP
jgi:transposase